MKERERLVISGLLVLLLLLWLGFLVHRDSRFAGSFWGGMLGVVGAVLMVVPLAYSLVKRGKWVRERVGRWVTMRTLLAWHIYAGILGPILALLHTGHKFNSPLGIALTAMMLLVVLSGFTGRYLMGYFTHELLEKRQMLDALKAAYDRTAGELARQPEQAAMLVTFSGFFSRVAARLFIPSPAAEPGSMALAVRALRQVESMADLEYAIKTHETFKRWFARWLKFHIIISVILYVLLALHVWAGIHFGLRWFP
jgi:hypothetical protein